MTHLKEISLLLCCMFFTLSCGSEPLADEDAGVKDGSQQQGADGDTDVDADGDADGDSDKDPCDPNPCTKDARTRCVVSTDGKSQICDCELGTMWDGKNCVTDPDPCNPNPCTEPHRSLCRQTGGETVCKCDLGYTLDDKDNCVAMGELEWVVMVFLNADNSLYTEGTADLKEMLATKVGKGLAVVVQYDGSKKDDSSQGFITVDGSTMYQNIGEINMGDWHELVKFVNWATDNFKAKHYLLDIWNHGSGWDLVIPPPTIHTRQRGDPAGASDYGEPGWRGVSSDETSGSIISVAKGDLESALKEITAHLGRKLDILAFDACLMQMWEVQYISEAYADYLLGSEETEPGPGYNYTLFLNGIIENPTWAAVDFCKHGVDAYKAASPQHSTQSCVDLSKTADLTAAIQDFASQVMTDMAGATTLGQTINAQCQSYSNPGNRDLYHLVQLVMAMPESTDAVKTKAQALMDVITGESVLNEEHQGRCNYTQTCDNSHGIAIFMPGVNNALSGANNIPLYRTGAGTRWSAETDWDDFVQAFTK